MEDLDIIRHDIQPGLQPGLQPGRRPGCRARDRACIPAENRGREARDFRDLPRKSAGDFRESAAGLRSPRPGLQSIINKIITS